MYVPSQVLYMYSLFITPSLQGTCSQYISTSCHRHSNTTNGKTTVPTKRTKSNCHSTGQSFEHTRPEEASTSSLPGHNTYMYQHHCVYTQGTHIQTSSRIQHVLGSKNHGQGTCTNHSGPVTNQLEHAIALLITVTRAFSHTSTPRRSAPSTAN